VGSDYRSTLISYLICSVKSWLHACTGYFSVCGCLLSVCSRSPPLCFPFLEHNINPHHYFHITVLIFCLSPIPFSARNVQPTGFWFNEFPTRQSTASLGARDANTSVHCKFFCKTGITSSCRKERKCLPSASNQTTSAFPPNQDPASSYTQPRCSYYGLIDLNTDRMGSHVLRHGIYY